MAPFFSCGAFALVALATDAKERAALTTANDAVVGSAVATVTGLDMASHGEGATAYTVSYSFTSADGARMTATEDISIVPVAGGVRGPGAGCRCTDRDAGQWSQWKQMRDSNAAVETPVR